MDEMVADIGREYEIVSGEQGEPPEVQNFYRLICGSEPVREHGEGEAVTEYQPP
jgi:hypothetical protein